MSSFLASQSSFPFAYDTWPSVSYHPRFHIKFTPSNYKTGQSDCADAWASTSLSSVLIQQLRPQILPHILRYAIHAVHNYVDYSWFENVSHFFSLYSGAATVNDVGVRIPQKFKLGVSDTPKI